MKHDLKIILAIIGIVVALVMFFQIKSCIVGKADAKISRLEGELAAAEKQAEKIKEDNQIAIDEMREEISRQATEIAAKNTTILELQKEDEKIVPTEVIDTPGVDQNWEIIAGINAQSSREWEAKYLKAQEVIAELGVPIKTGIDNEGNPIFIYPRDSVTWKLDQKYLLSEERAKKYKQNWEIAENLHRISKSINVEKDKKIARLKVGKTLERIILTPLAVFGGLKLTGVIK